MLEQEVVSERDQRAKTDRTKNDIARDLEDALEQLRISRNNNDTKEKELKVSTITVTWIADCINRVNKRN